MGCAAVLTLPNPLNTMLINCLLLNVILKSTVMVKEGLEKAIQKEVSIGVSNGSIVEIKSGLAEGEIVLTP